MTFIGKIDISYNESKSQAFNFTSHRSKPFFYSLSTFALLPCHRTQNKTKVKNSQKKLLRITLTQMKLSFCQNNVIIECDAIFLWWENDWVAKHTCLYEKKMEILPIAKYVWLFSHFAVWRNDQCNSFLNCLSLLVSLFDLIINLIIYFSFVKIM